MKKYSELRDLKRAPLADLLPLKFPFSIYIETTNRCNFRCRYCPMSRNDYSKIAGGFRTMNMPEFEKVCQDIKDGGKIKVLRFYFMGEPLLNPRLPEMIKMACQMNLAERTELTTNGALLSAGKAKDIIDSGLDYLRISISGIKQGRHQHVTQSAADIKQIYINIKQFREMRDKMNREKPYLYIKMIDSLDETENSEFLQMYQELGDEVVVEKLMNWDDYEDYNFLEAAYGKEDISDSKKLYSYPKAVCPFPFYTLMINVNGDVTACCVDWNKATRVGNVFEEPLKHIWNGEKMRDFRRMHILRQKDKNPSCRGCRFLFTTPDNLDNISKEKADIILGEKSEIKK